MTKEIWIIAALVWIPLHHITLNLASPLRYNTKLPTFPLILQAWWEVKILRVRLFWAKSKKQMLIQFWKSDPAVRPLLSSTGCETDSDVVITSLWSFERPLVQITFSISNLRIPTGHKQGIGSAAQAWPHSSASNSNRSQQSAITGLYFRTPARSKEGALAPDHVL